LYGRRSVDCVRRGIGYAETEEREKTLVRFDAFSSTANSRWMRLSSGVPRLGCWGSPRARRVGGDRGGSRPHRFRERGGEGVAIRKDRVHVVPSGSALSLRCLGRAELLMSKVFALCDRRLDIQDCLALAPTPEEFEPARPWLEKDANPEWPSHMRAVLYDLVRRLTGGL
jgi:hypothetical protein